MNFLEYLDNAQKGDFVGVPTGVGIIDEELYGISKNMIITIAAESKVGKTALTNNIIYGLYDHVRETKFPIEVLYFNFENPELEQIARAISHYSYRYYGTFIDSNTILGRKFDANKKFIGLTEKERYTVEEVYNKLVHKLFYSDFMTYFEKRVTPEMLRNFLINHAKKNSIVESNSYKPKNKKKITVVVIDHLRLLKSTGTIKNTIDNMSRYMVEIKNNFGYTFISNIHLNRSVLDIEAIKNNKNYYYPSDANIKDTGNLGEDSTTLITMFNPKDKKYGLAKHFNRNLDQLPDNYRTLHICLNRFNTAPVHYGTEVLLGPQIFTKQIKL